MSMPDGRCHTRSNASINSSGIVAVIAALPVADNALDYTAKNFINITGFPALLCPPALSWWRRRIDRCSDTEGKTQQLAGRTWTGQEFHMGWLPDTTKWNPCTRNSLKKVLITCSFGGCLNSVFLPGRMPQTGITKPSVLNTVSYRNFAKKSHVRLYISDVASTAARSQISTVSTPRPAAVAGWHFPAARPECIPVQVMAGTTTCGHRCIQFRMYSLEEINLVIETNAYYFLKIDTSYNIHLINTHHEFMINESIHYDYIWQHNVKHITDLLTFQFHYELHQMKNET